MAKSDKKKRYHKADRNRTIELTSRISVCAEGKSSEADIKGTNNYSITVK